MLNKKQYCVTLLAAVIVFFTMLGAMAWYFSQRPWTGSSMALQKEEPQPTLEPAAVQPKGEIILPQTKITVKVKDLAAKKEEKATVAASSLLGLTKEELAAQFEGYTIETFNEKEVCLSKTVTGEKAPEGHKVFVLGVADGRVCIREKDTDLRPVEIDYEVGHLSKYIYSILLNEEIQITKEQKEALLLNPNALQKILQEYIGE